ncbi:Ig-like domain-containing protein [Paenibacillus illinoisensis]|uniref:Ig-like domain-containing protein n=1 Tax=Paenibacillus illinoisensis TaxID=59845 RepID=UPI00203B4198|nr:SwmB domain-containing protein [Paenibacillus illinoisensis]MCM3207910.1 Ig-like domain-containing protein [Paenibacillus illinoisensis]
MKKIQKNLQKVMLLCLVFVLMSTVWPSTTLLKIQAVSSLSDLGIVSSTPSPGAIGVDGTQSLTIEFNQLVKKGTGNITIKRISDNTEALPPISMADGRVVIDTIADPSATYGTNVSINNLNLAGGGYYVLVDQGVFTYADDTPFIGISDASRWTFWTSGVGAPTVTQLSPENGATRVLPAANFKLSFSKDVYPASGTISIFNVSNDGLVEAIPVTSTQVTGGGTSNIIVNPANDLTNNTSYYVTVSAGSFRDAQQNETPAIVKGNWNFNVSTDTTPLVVSSLYPADGASSAPINSGLTITFNKELDPAYKGTVTLRKSTGTPVAVTTSIDSTNPRVVRIVPQSNLENSSIYYVDVASGGFRDKAGNIFAGLTGTTSWSFKTYTKDTTAPILQTAKMYTNTMIQLTYDKSLNNAVNPSTSSYSVTVNGENRNVSSAYISGSSVYVVLDTGVAVGQIVRMSYTPGVRPVQDTSLNAATAFSGREVVNGLDSVMSKPREGYVYGSTLTLYFPESVYVTSSNAKNQFTVTANGSNVGISSISVSSGSAVVLYLDRNITSSEIAKVSYEPGSDPIKDLRSQTLAGFSDFYIRNSLDTIPPEFQKAEVNGSKLTIKYNEALSRTNIPLKSQFSILVNNAPLYVTGVEILDDTVTLTLASPITANQNATLSYVPGSLRLTDLNGNPAGYLNLVPLTQTSGNGGIKTAILQGDTITLTFNNNVLNQTGLTNSQFVVKANGNTVNVLSASSSGSTVVLKLMSAVPTGQTVTLSYSPEYVPLRDSQNQVIAAFGPINVTNSTNSTATDTGSTNLPAWLSLKDASLFGQSMYVMNQNAASTVQTQSRYSRSVRHYNVDADKIKEGFKYTRSLGGSLHMLVFEVPTTDTAAYVDFPLNMLQEVYAEDRGAAIGVQLADQLWTISLSKLNFAQIASSAGASIAETKLAVQFEPVPSTSAGTMDGLLLGANASKFSELTDIYLSASSPYKAAGELELSSDFWVRLPGTPPATSVGLVQFDKSIARLSSVPHTPVQVANALVLRGKLAGNQTLVVTQHIVRFSDIASHWARPTLEEMASKWIIDGQDGMPYQPDLKITRAEFAVMVAKGLGLTGSQETAQRFKDVSYGTTTSAYIGAATKAGIITGYKDGTFKPSNLITREQMAVMMVRVMDYAKQSPTLRNSAAATLSKFKDNKKIQSKEIVAQAVQEGIIQGITTNTFQPAGSATRAQAAVMLKRVLNKIGYL